MKFNSHLINIYIFIESFNNLIEKKILKIKMNEKINEISNKNLIELFCIINAFNIKEIEKGNEYNKG